MTLADPLFALLSVIVLCAAFANHPTRAECPDGWYVEGVRPSGDYHCRPRSLLPDHAVRGHDVDDPFDPATDHVIRGAIYCTGGSSPIVVSERIVGCEAVH